MQITSSGAGGNEYHPSDSDDDTSQLPLDDSFFYSGFVLKCLAALMTL